MLTFFVVILSIALAVIMTLGLAGAVYANRSALPMCARRVRFYPDFLRYLVASQQKTGKTAKLFRQITVYLKLTTQLSVRFGFKN